RAGAEEIGDEADSANSVIAGEALREARRSTSGDGEDELLFLILQLVKLVIDPADCEQFLMGALLAKPSLVEDENTIGMLNGAETMRDDHSGAAGDQAVECFANYQLRFCIDA